MNNKMKDYEVISSSQEDHEIQAERLEVHSYGSNIIVTFLIRDEPKAQFLNPIAFGIAGYL